MPTFHERVAVQMCARNPSFCIVRHACQIKHKLYYGVIDGLMTLHLHQKKSKNQNINQR